MTTLVGLALLGLVIFFGILDGIAWYTVLIELVMAFVLYAVLRAIVEIYFENKISNIEKYYNSKIDNAESPEEKKFLRRKADRASRELCYKLELEESAMTFGCFAIVISLFFFPAWTTLVLSAGVVVCLAGLVVPVKTPSKVSNSVQDT